MSNEKSVIAKPYHMVHGIVTVLVHAEQGKPPHPVELNANAVFVNHDGDKRLGAKALAVAQQCLQQRIKERHTPEDWAKVQVVDICIANVVYLGDFEGEADFQRGMEELVKQAEAEANARKAAAMQKSVEDSGKAKATVRLVEVKGDNLDELIDGNK